MDAEQYIKSKLDGTFTSVRWGAWEPEFTTRKVPLDFLPTYDAVPKPTGKRGPGTMPRHIWTPEEDIELQHLRRLGWTRMRCARVFNCSEGAVRHRLTILRQREVYP